MERRVAIVTGASRGIGQAVAQRLARDGLTVIGVARTVGPGSQSTWLDEGPAGPGNPVHFFCGDVSLPNTAREVATYATNEFGRVDVLVNNAGIEHDTPFDESTDSDYRSTFDTNVGGLISFAREVVPVMRRQGGGLICVVASVCSLRGFSGASVYCGSKFALLGIVESLQEEYRTENIRVSAVLPGWVNTALADDAGLPDERYRAMILQPDDVANVISFVVASPPDVVLERIVVRPLVERPYSGLLDLS